MSIAGELASAASSAVSELDRLTVELVLAGEEKAALEADLAQARSDYEAAVRGSLPKPVAGGMLTRSGGAPAGYADSFSGKSSELAWKDLEPAPGVYDFSSIEAAIAAGYNRHRIMCGVQAPQWAKNLAGGPVHILDPWDGKEGDVPRWFEPALWPYYEALHSRIAAEYDSEARFQEVSASLCTTIYAEPFMRQTGSAATRTNLLAAGYTRPKDEAALRAMVECHRVYRRTRTGIAHNPFQWVKPDGSAGYDVAFTVSMLTFERLTLGDLAVLQNNSLDDPADNAASETTLYNAIRDAGGAIAFQTVAASRITSAAQMRALLDYGVSLGASALELSPGGWQAFLSPAEAAAYDDALRAHADTVR